VARHHDHYAGLVGMLELVVLATTNVDPALTLEAPDHLPGICFE
jgi:hypothetical protein